MAGRAASPPVPEHGQPCGRPVSRRYAAPPPPGPRRRSAHPILCTGRAAGCAPRPIWPPFPARRGTGGACSRPCLKRRYDKGLCNSSAADPRHTRVAARSRRPQELGGAAATSGQPFSGLPTEAIGGGRGRILRRRPMEWHGVPRRQEVGGPHPPPTGQTPQCGQVPPQESCRRPGGSQVGGIRPFPHPPPAAVLRGVQDGMRCSACPTQVLGRDVQGLGGQA